MNPINFFNQEDALIAKKTRFFITFSSQSQMESIKAFRVENYIIYEKEM